MTMQSWVSVIDQTTDAAFRTWVAEFIAKVTAAGLVQTSDTGQINTSTVTRAAINTDAGYAIFRFNDTQQATAPVFIRFNFGSSSAITMPRISVQIGTASNGSGTISGLGSTFTDIIAGGSSISSTTTMRSSFCCAVDGCFWISWKIGATSAGGVPPEGFIFMSRYTDNTGAATSGGLTTIYSPLTGVAYVPRSFNYADGTTFTSTTLNFLPVISWGVTSTLVGGVPQVYQVDYITPRVKPNNFASLVLQTELAIGTQFQGILTGSTTRNYISAASSNASSITSFGLIWE